MESRQDPREAQRDDVLPHSSVSCIRTRRLLILIGLALRPESYYEADVDPNTKNVLDVGQQLDPYAAAKTNGGLFEKGLLVAKEVEGGKAREVKVVANGHCHGAFRVSVRKKTTTNDRLVSDNCRRVLGVWLCFGGGGYVFLVFWFCVVVTDRTTELMVDTANQDLIAGSGFTRFPNMVKRLRRTSGRNGEMSLTI